MKPIKPILKQLMLPILLIDFSELLIMRTEISDEPLNTLAIIVAITFIYRTGKIKEGLQFKKENSFEIHVAFQT